MIHFLHQKVSSDWLSRGLMLNSLCCLLARDVWTSLNVIFQKAATLDRVSKYRLLSVVFLIFHLCHICTGLFTYNAFCMQTCNEL